MSNFPKYSFRTSLFTFFYFLIAAAGISAADFSNPVLKAPNADCATNNLQAERFNADVSPGERLKICLALDKITGKLNRTAWSPALSNELKSIWQVFSNEAVILRSMPGGVSSQMHAMAEPFPSGAVGKNFEAAVYVRPDKSDAASFFQVLFHELRHVYDFHDTWKNKTVINSLELERRAFLLMSKITQETPEKENFSNLPKFWKDSWAKLPPQEIAARREAAVERYLQGNKFYRALSQGESKHALDFSNLRKTAKSNDQQAAVSYGKGGERLPNRPALPQTTAVLPQNIQEISFNLEKPKNPRDEKEILRVALSNEKKLYYGMNNFVYDQNLQFQCWKKGKVAASISENNTVARGDNGSALFQKVSIQSAPNVSPCMLDSRNLKTDFTETFWVSPALEKMPIRFSGFVEVEGKTLARYTVLQPDERLFQQLANEFHQIKPFRVFVGSIFVSPEDGQIVKFWGTSYPEDTVTGSRAKKVWGSYSVTALRQKLNIDRGLWVTVYVGTVAVANIGGNAHPFSYTVKFENYRQSSSDVRILDDETPVADTMVSKNIND
jgi:hypothetical protein